MVLKRKIERQRKRYQLPAIDASTDEVCMFTCLIVVTVAKVTATPRATANAVKTNLGFILLPRLCLHPTNI
jgi:hypothetical protein